MAKRKRTKWQTTIYKTLHRKLKIEQHKHNKKLWWTQVLRKGKQLVFRKGKQLLFHYGAGRVAPVINPVISHALGENWEVLTTSGT